MKKLATKRRSRYRNRLIKLWRDLTKSQQNLWYIVVNIKYLPLRKLALREFLKLDLIFDDFYEIIDDLEKIFKKITDEQLEKKFWQKCFELASPDNLLSIIKFRRAYCKKRAWIELQNRIQSGSIGENHTKQILLETIEYIDEPKLATDALEELKKLTLSYGEIEQLSRITAPPYDKLSILSAEKLQKLIKRIKKKSEKGEKTDAKILQQMHELVEKLKD